MKHSLIVCLFLISLNLNGQTGAGPVEQTFIFQLLDKNGKKLNQESIDSKEISIMNSEVNNLIFNQLDKKGAYTIVCNGIRYYGDYSYIKSKDIQLIYELENEIMTIDIKNIQTAYLKIIKIPFKSGNYTIDLQRESDFVKKLIIEPTKWNASKVLFEEKQKVKR